MPRVAAVEPWGLKEGGGEGEGERETGEEYSKCCDNTGNSNVVDVE